MNKLDFLQQSDLLKEAEKELVRRRCRSSYYEYVIYTNQKTVPGGYKRSRFHQYLTDKIQEFVEKKTGHSFDILVLSVPPQKGKSVTVSQTLPSWYLGHNPSHRIIVASYNEDMASMFGRSNLSKIEEFGDDIFGLKLKDSPKNNTEFETVQNGRCILRGLTGGITGNAANLIIIDDPIKNQEEAESVLQRAKIWNAYITDVRTRLAAGAKVIIIQTRWHEEDLYGKIVQTEKNVTRINIPEECEDPENDPLGRELGDALCPEIGKGNAWLKDYKQFYINVAEDGGEKAWYALFQGSPRVNSGNIFKKESWKYYSSEELPEINCKIISVDATFKETATSDFVSIQCWGKTDDKYYLIDLIKKRMGFVDTVDAIRSMRNSHPDAAFVYIEEAANGNAIIETLHKEMDGIIPVKPEGGKESRARAISLLVERCMVYLPKFASYTMDFVDECSRFPNSIHDDQVDAMSQALNRLKDVNADLEVVPAKKKYKKWTNDMYADYYSASEDVQIELHKLWGYPDDWEE